MGRTIVEMLEEANDHPSTVTFLPDGVRTSFRALWDLSSRASATLSELPVGATIAGVLTSSAPGVATLLGAWRAGLRFISLPMPHRGQTPDTYADMIEELCKPFDAELVILESRYAGFLGTFERRVEAAEAVVEGGTRPRDVPGGALVQFSSGTLGAPKPLRLSLEAVAANVSRMLARLAIGPGDRSCQWTPLSHDMGLVGGLLTTWAASNRRFLGSAPAAYTSIRPEAFLQSSDLWMRTCSEMGATVTAGPTFAYAIAARHLQRDNGGLDLSRLRTCLVGAEPVSGDILRTFEATAQPLGLPDTAMTPAYGLAEAALCVTMVAPEARWSTQSFDFDGQPTELVSCGRPLRDYEISAGEAQAAPIVVSGPSLCGRWNGRWEATSQLDTGDLGFVHHGELFVSGRRDDMLKVAGRAVRCHDLEQALEGASSVVRAGNCAVVRTDGGYAAVFECRAGPKTELQRECMRVAAALVGRAGLGPSLVLAVERGALPKTPSGKLRRRAIERNLEEYHRDAIAFVDRRKRDRD